VQSQAGAYRPPPPDPKEELTLIYPWSIGADTGGTQKKRPGPLVWLLVGVFALILVVGSYFAYQKFFNKDDGGNASVSPPPIEDFTPTPTATPEPTPSNAPTPTPEEITPPVIQPRLSGEEFNQIIVPLAGLEASFCYAEYASDYSNAKNGSTSRAISGLVSIPVLYSVLTCIDNGTLEMTSGMYYVNSGGRGSDGMLGDRENGELVSVHDLLYDMLNYCSNSATNTFIDYFSAGSLGINEICRLAGFGSVDIKNKLGGGDNYASAEDIADMLTDLWRSHRDILIENYGTVPADSAATIGFLRDIIGTWLKALGSNGYKETFYVEAAIFYDPSDTELAYVMVLLGSGGGTDIYADIAAQIGAAVYEKCR